MKQLKIHLLRLSKMLLDDEKNRRIIGISTFLILGLIALVMTIINIFTKKGLLTLTTAVFSVLCFVNLLLTLRSERSQRVATILFSAEMLVLFMFFLVSGSPEGFSAIWICMLPTLGLLFFGRSYGSILCTGMLAIMVFLLWFPAGNALLQYDYTSSFKMRFPILFTSFFVLSLFLESLRIATANEMKRAQRLYKELSIKDSLTGVLNRQGMYSAVEEGAQFKNENKLGIAMFDLDDFKKVNDTYGHNAGDAVLKGFAEILSKNLDALICRWGGEEFVVVFSDGRVSFEDLQRVREEVAQAVFSFDGNDLHVTVSAGLFETELQGIERLDHMIDLADSALYEAKRSGKNQVIRFGHKMDGV